MTLKAWDIITVIVGAGAIVFGIVEAVTKKIYFRHVDKKDEHKVAEFAPKDGLLWALAGVGFILMGLSAELNVLPYYCYWGGWLIFFACVLIDNRMYRDRFPK